MPSLYGTFPPTWPVPKSVPQRIPTAAPAAPTSYRYAPGTHDFAMDGNGRVLRSTPTETTLTWAAKSMTTQRGRYVIYDRDFGVDLEAALRLPTRSATENALSQDMRHAALRDGRVRDVQEFAFGWGPDNELRVAYIVVLADGSRHVGTAVLNIAGSPHV